MLPAEAFSIVVATDSLLANGEKPLTWFSVFANGAEQFALTEGFLEVMRHNPHLPMNKDDPKIAEAFLDLISRGNRQRRDEMLATIDPSHLVTVLVIDYDGQWVSLEFTSSDPEDVSEYAVHYRRVDNVWELHCIDAIDTTIYDPAVNIFGHTRVNDTTTLLSLLDNTNRIASKVDLERDIDNQQTSDLFAYFIGQHLVTLVFEDNLVDRSEGVGENAAPVAASNNTNKKLH